MLYSTKYRGGTIVQYLDHEADYVVIGRASWEPEERNMFIISPDDLGWLVGYEDLRVRAKARRT